VIKQALAAVAVLIALFVAGTAYNVYTAPARVINKTLDTDNIINNYEWFKRQYNDIKAIDKKIVIAENNVEKFKNDAGPRSDWTFEDKNEAARLDAIATGLKTSREDMVSLYNSRSQMANRAIFKTNDLPETVE
jgi:hypothetical protein